MASLPSLRRQPRKLLRDDRLTLALAASAVAMSGAVIATEFTRRFRRRVHQAHPETQLPEGPVDALQLAGRASQDTLLVAYEGYAGSPYRDRALLNLFSGFAGAFLWARVSTAGIRSGWWPFGNVRVSGRHIHHYVPGIVLAFAAGGAAIITESREIEAWLAIPFGIGAGLTLDEAALLVELDDVYWLPPGRLSVQVSAATVSILGATILGLRLLQRGEQRGESAGMIPGSAVVPAPS